MEKAVSELKINVLEYILKIVASNLAKDLTSGEYKTLISLLLLFLRSNNSLNTDEEGFYIDIAYTKQSEFLGIPKRTIEASVPSLRKKKLIDYLPGAKTTGPTRFYLSSSLVINEVMITDSFNQFCSNRSIKAFADGSNEWRFLLQKLHNGVISRMKEGEFKLYVNLVVYYFLQCEGRTWVRENPSIDYDWKKHITDFGVSETTVKNSMVSLEEKGYIQTEYGMDKPRITISRNIKKEFIDSLHIRLWRKRKVKIDEIIEKWIEMNRKFEKTTDRYVIGRVVNYIAKNTDPNEVLTAIEEVSERGYCEDTIRAVEALLSKNKRKCGAVSTYAKPDSTTSSPPIIEKILNDLRLPKNISDVDVKKFEGILFSSNFESVDSANLEVNYE